MSGPRTVRAPRGTDLTCRNWLSEAAYRMIQNNLDPEVAERPDDLVVYGGRGKAARSWQAAAEARSSYGGPAVSGPGDFSAVMERVRRLRAELSDHDSAERFRRLGVDVFLGRFQELDDAVYHQLCEEYEWKRAA